MVGIFAEMQEQFKNGTYDLTDNGKCTQCGKCCSNLLPMTDEEINIIRKYIKRHHIKEHRHFLPLAEPAIDMTCPFLNDDKKTEKCNIYPVKPFICTAFLCSEPKGALTHKELYREKRKIVNLRKEFFEKG